MVHLHRSVASGNGRGFRNDCRPFYLGSALSPDERPRPRPIFGSRNYVFIGVRDEALCRNGLRRSLCDFDSEFTELEGFRAFALLVFGLLLFLCLCARFRSALLVS